MSAPLIAPERENFPKRIRWTVAECYRLVESGELCGRYELIDGEIISKIGQGPAHSLLLMLIADWLVGVFSKLNVREQLPIRVPGEAGRFTEPEPDLAVTIEPTTAYAARHPGPDDLVLAVEVADSSLEFDLTTKALLYARAGIRGYWVADIASRQVHVHRNPAEDGYRSIERLVCGESVSLAARPEATVDIDTFFPSAIAGPSEAPII